MNPPRPSTTEVVLEGLRTAYANTENPFFVWMAIHWCTNEDPQIALPNWCLGYLADVARQLNAFSRIAPVELNNAGTKNMPAALKAAKLLNVLGFTSRGRNAFKDGESQFRSIEAATKFRILRRTGTPYEIALKEVMNSLGESDESNAKAIIRKGRRILGVKPS